MTFTPTDELKVIWEREYFSNNIAFMSLAEYFAIRTEEYRKMKYEQHINCLNELISHAMKSDNLIVRFAAIQTKDLVKHIKIEAGTK